MSGSPAGPVAGPTDARQLVADGYDHIAERYRDWTKPHDPTRSWFVDEVIARVPSGSDVVELGVGSGGTVTEELVAAYRFTGVDISPSQVALARASHAEGDFRVADLLT
ncbi:MAG: class I SAM-dependent methyltransferase, partial [Actinomycetota bacterium]